MKTNSIMTLAMLIVAGGLALHITHAQAPGITRTDLQRHDLSVPGREVIQVRVDFDPGVAFGKHSHPGAEVAYVLEGEEAFRSRCNTELVGFDEISADEALELRGWIAEHAEWTGSTVAQRVLGVWDNELARFVKVMSHDYKRALTELASEQELPEVHA